MLANSDKKQDLIAHSRAVANVSKAMALHLALEGKLVDRAYWAGMFHDVGKAIGRLQKYFSSESDLDETEDKSKNILNLPYHHEISWAFVADKTDDERVLNFIYWTHGRPIHDDGGYFQDRDDILSSLNAKDLESLNVLWDKLSKGYACSSPKDSCKVPDMYTLDGTGNKNINSEYLLIRSCVISADRYVSRVLNSEDCLKVAEGDVSGIVDQIVEGNINGETIRPDTYDEKRFSTQLDCAEKAKDKTTTIVRAPAGLGKTMIGILWGLKRGRKVVWVCPRNEVARSVYENINREIEALGLSCKAELYLTGKRECCNFEQDFIVDDSTDVFNSDIIVTNIDSVLSPMVSSNASWRLFLIFGTDVVLDEYHEFISDAPLYAAFIIFMRARHRVASNCHTLLLSATPTNVHALWESDDRPVTILPDRGTHYQPVHDIPYKTGFSDTMPAPVGGSLSINNSIANAQNEYKKGCYRYLAHSHYIDSDRKKIFDGIKKDFGKKGQGIAESKNVSSAPVIQAAMDLSFKSLGESVCSPESTLQRIGRVNRWGELKESEILFVEFKDNRSDACAVQCSYESNLRSLWIDHLKKFLKGRDSIKLVDIYNIYNEFYKEKGNQVLTFLQNQYKRGLEGSPKNKQLGLVSFWPAKIQKVSNNTNPSKGGRNLRNPTGSYFFSTKINGTKNDWLGPDDVMSEGLELYHRYSGNSQLNIGLLGSGKMLLRLKGLVNAGFNKYSKYIKKNNIPCNLDKWFRLAKNNETPLPDFSRVYDSELGLISSASD